MILKIIKDINGHKKSSFQGMTSDVYEYHNGITLSFECINYRFPEIMNLHINIPAGLLRMDTERIEEIPVFAEGHILRAVSPIINEYGKSLCNDSKEIRVQGSVKMQISDGKTVRRTGALYKDGSIWVREKDNYMPKTGAVPFKAPAATEHTIKLKSGDVVTGMIIGVGLTVITKGGYSGKTTIIDAMESGIYNHIKGDGREYVITDEMALKVYAEDGRTVNNLDMSPFFNGIFQGKA